MINNQDEPHTSSGTSDDDDNDDDNYEIGEPQLEVQVEDNGNDEVRESDEPQLEEEVYEIDIGYLDSGNGMFI